MNKEHLYKICYEHCKQYDELFSPCIKECTQPKTPEEIATFLSADYKKLLAFRHAVRKLLENGELVDE